MLNITNLLIALAFPSFSFARVSKGRGGREESATREVDEVQGVDDDDEHLLPIIPFFFLDGRVDGMEILRGGSLEGIIGGGGTKIEGDDDPE